MQFWAVCIVCFYVALALFNWVTGLHWLAEASLPLSILAGVGLAIASSTSTTSLPPTESTTDVPTPPEPEPAPQKAATQKPPAPQQHSPSISFTINKNRRP
ncbi:hypothetical protein N836_17830 [Leptolyngbya sp. Heron Island J]|uniref:hypothetical protein n=1 Tax=Leptolyngbya sp. Heron Island J TaxID=1385935 RepID=UPI0003B9907D|nr:hypothetical protein [Leptolyngbya sp. Heron Island J]ESA34278.1 hypothetical protein N836_17830 [Leptolyngbya sp. Heron Island J]